MPHHPAPRPAHVAGSERIGPYLVHVVPARRLAPDDLAGALDGVGVVDAVAFVADSEHGGPATLGLDRGVWYRIRQGIRGLLVPDERGLAVCYMLCEPASHYYQVMTRSNRMPVLIEERI
jgi:hypothetical protein